MEVSLRSLGTYSRRNPGEEEEKHKKRDDMGKTGLEKKKKVKSCLQLADCTCFLHAALRTAEQGSRTQVNTYYVVKKIDPDFFSNLFKNPDSHFTKEFCIVTIQNSSVKWLSGFLNRFEKHIFWIEFFWFFTT